MPIEISGHPFCDALPKHLRVIVDMMAPQFQREAWPVRFVALLSMLEDMVEQLPDATRPHVINNWVVIVTALLEKLPRDLTSIECLVLMRHSAVENFRHLAFQLSPDFNRQNEILRGMRAAVQKSATVAAE